jgi:hypothetical protein
MPHDPPRVKFESVPTKVGDEFYVRVTLPDGRQPQIDGFKTRSEAQRWIKAQSAAWLKMYEGGKHA